MTAWAGDSLVEFRGARVPSDAVPVWESLLAVLPVCDVAEGDDRLTLRLRAGAGKSAGFPIRDTRRACKEAGVSWGYPEAPEYFTVIMSRDAARLRWGVRGGSRFRRALSRGDYGDDVQAVQEALAGRGSWDGPCDGRFTQAFMLAVREFQGAVGQRITGEVNRLTWDAAMGD